MLIWGFLILILSRLLLRNWNLSFYRPKGFPPGPIQFPIVGNLLPFRRSPLKAMMNWKKQYGKIVGLRLGDFRAILINDYDLIKEAFNKEAFNGRPAFKPAHLFVGGESHGTLTSTGDPWDTVRRFTIKNLNNIGFGKKSMESYILCDISNLLESIRKEINYPINFKDKFYITATNHLWYILMGQEIPPVEREKFQSLLVNLNKALWQPIGSSIWFLPWLSYWIPGITGLTKLKEMLSPVQNLLKEEVKKHLPNIYKTNEHSETGNKPENLMHAFLKEITKMEDDPKSHFYRQIGHNHMKGMIMNLFVTTGEVITNTLNWSLLYLSLYPAEQDRFYREIVDVIGQTRMPTLNDLYNMPYTKALMQEVLRISSNSPFSNFHLTTQDTKLHGYFIPKDTIVIANLYGIHHDENVWQDPECFRPQRFIESSTLSNAPPVIPFSVGMRKCFGETFAKKEFFLILVSLIQQFSFEWNPQVPRPTHEELTEKSHVSMFRFSMPFLLIVRERQFPAAG